MGLFNDRDKNQQGKTGVPVWFMRQAGRYHSHYQNIKKNSDFMTMCKDPTLACEITMGPIDEFNFDAAILFSDLLFPLEQLGMGLNYHAGPPQLDMKLDSFESIKKLKKIKDASNFYNFQKEALTLLKNKLPQNKTLLGFTGAPFTLYAYAVEGSHSGNLIDSKKGLYDGRFMAFMEQLLPELEQNLMLQAQGGADALCLFDTAVGELTKKDFKTFVAPVLKGLTKKIKSAYPEKNIIYYSKFTHLDYLRDLEDENIDVLGIDWRHDLTQALKVLSPNYMIQGNLDPSHLHLPWSHLEENLKDLWQKVEKSQVSPDRWIMGLGHGVLPLTPEENVKKTVEFVHQHFRY